jgi:type I restriction enzyme S subunit
VGEWPLVAIDDLVEDIIDRRGVTPLKLGSGFTPAGHRVISAKLVKGGAIDLAADEPRFVDDPTYARWMRSPLRADDVFLTSEAPLGEVAYLRSDVDWVLGQRLFALRSDKRRLHGRWLYYALQTDPARSDLNSRATGTTAQGIRQTELRRVRIPLPPLTEQRRVAGILGSLDDKIELNRRMTKTLEATARALFRSWFVDVDSPQVSGADDWVDGTLEDLADLNPEVWPSRDRPSVLRYVDLSGTKWGRIGAVADYPADEAPSRAQRILRPGDTIVGTVRPGNGSYALVTRDGLTGSTGFAQLRPKRPRDAAFVYLAATARANLDSLAHLADGGAYPAVRPALVAATPVVVPDDRTLQAFSVAASPFLERAALAIDESEILAAIRDSLLPRLLSGDIEVAGREVADDPVGASDDLPLASAAGGSHADTRPEE